MRQRPSVLAMLAILGLISSVAIADETPGRRQLNELRVLYVGSERPEEYIEFLRNHVGQIEAVSREAFQPERATNIDVVLLNWPQSPETHEMRKLRSPLGTREAWNRPTVLLGSAGLNLAVAWKMQGGSGCTCMEPLAYGFREHEIFNHPYPIQMAAMIRIPTPQAFVEELKAEEIEVLPLVDDYAKSWRSGWCTYSTSFDKNPDVEYFCGGVNHKTPTAAGIWRQGNFLHYGFELSPREMNEHARLLLLNSIAYISRFTEDRAIASTPSVFGGPVSRPRRTPEKWLAREDYQVAWVLDMFEPKPRALLANAGDRAQQAEWCKERSRYFYAAQEHLLGIDEDLQQLMIPFDAPEFFDRVLSGLDASDAKVAERSRRLLARYVPCGPGQQATGSQWRKWHVDNHSYLFALDTGDYRWYIDPLAKKRQTPSSELRGPLRVDQFRP